jgi:hypothetical protein
MFEFFILNRFYEAQYLAISLCFNKDCSIMLINCSYFSTINIEKQLLLQNSSFNCVGVLKNENRMKQIVKYFIYPFFWVSLFCILPDIAFSQQPCNDPADPLPEPDLPTCPVDGNISLMLAAGVGYGIKKLIDERRKKTAELI